MAFKNVFLLMLVSFFIFASCKNDKKSEDKTMKDSVKLTINKYPERIQKSIIYEVNIRQFSTEGTFAAFEKEIPRLKELGVEILWLMPIQPVGLKNRKGSLGSYYSVQNYTEVNPEFGSKDDFERLVKTAHENGMLVILDWVANHTAFDNPWITAHPEWYTQDSLGNIKSPVDDWSDVADLNYDNKEMRAEMIKSLEYWIKEFDVDGYRCDVAFMCPTDFWNDVRVALDKVKPVFMLAEAEHPELMESAFDMCYTWDLHHLMNDIAKGTKRGVDLIDYFLDDPTKFPKGMRMVFTSNHDENSWNGTEFERMPDCYKTFAVFSYVVPSMPLIYTGQEACLDKRLKFFDKDTIDWKECDMTELYKKLAKLKQDNKALWNGTYGSPLVFAATVNNENITSFIRQKDDNKILVLMNLSKKPTEVKYTDENAFGTYKEYFTGKEIVIEKNKSYKLQPWEYWVLIK